MRGRARQQVCTPPPCHRRAPAYRATPAPTRTTCPPSPWHRQAGTQQLAEAARKRRNRRKWIWLGIILSIVLTIIIVVVVVFTKYVQPGTVEPLMEMDG